MNFTALVVCLSMALESWSPPKYHPEEDEQAYRDRTNRFNVAIATVALDENEPPILGGDNGRERTALYMLSQAVQESHLVRYVDEGQCNDWQWRLTAEGKRAMLRGDCDGGIAFTPWQMHINANGGGTVLTKLGWVGAEWAEDNASVIHGKDAVNNKVLGARVALHWMRQTPGAWGSRGAALNRSESWWKRQGVKLCH
jgi:hypothetical protein